MGLLGLRGLPIVNISDGRECGRIESFIINPASGFLEAFILSCDSGDISVPVIPFSAIRKFGMFAATVSEVTSVSDISQNPELETAYRRNVDLIASAVFAGVGKTPIGFVRDAAINLKTGAIIALNISADSGFTSPYAATVSFGDVESAETGNILLKESCTPVFTSSGAGFMEVPAGAKFAPLAVMEPQWRNALSDRVAEEAEKLRAELRRILEVDIKKYLPPDNSENLRMDILEKISLLAGADSVKSLAHDLHELIAKLSGNMQAANSRIDNIIAADVPSFVEKEIQGVRKNIEDSIAALSAKMDDSATALDAATKNISSMVESEIKKFESDMISRVSRSVSSASSRMDELIRHDIPAIVETSIVRLKEETDARLHGLEEKLTGISSPHDDIDLPSLVMKEIVKAEEGLRSRFSNTEHGLLSKFSDLETRMRELEAMNSATLSRLRDRLDKMESGLAENNADDRRQARLSSEAVSAFEKTGEALRNSMEDLRRESGESLSLAREEIDSTVTSLFEELSSRIDELGRQASPSQVPTPGSFVSVKDLLTETSVLDKRFRKVIEAGLGAVRGEIETRFKELSAAPPPDPAQDESLREIKKAIAAIDENLRAMLEKEIASLRAGLTPPPAETPAGVVTQQTIAHEGKAAPPPAPEPAGPASPVVAATQPRESAGEPSAPQPPSLPPIVENGLNKYEIMLLGKKARMDITLSSGEFLVRKGNTINESVILRAKETGRLFDLSQSLTLF